jgi:hypothetical protein
MITLDKPELQISPAVLSSLFFNHRTCFHKRDDSLQDRESVHRKRTQAWISAGLDFSRLGSAEDEKGTTGRPDAIAAR